MASPGKKSFLLRLDPGLWADVQRLAAAELRSINAQVEFLLRDAVSRRKKGGGASRPPPPAERAKDSPR